jgi:hypothetical protein
MPIVIFPSGGSGGGSSNLVIQEEGVQVQTAVTTINFVGADVQAQAGGSGIAIVYIPTPTFASHYNSEDGTTDGRVNDTNSLGVATKFICAPTSEGTPFNTGGWAGTNQSASAVDFVDLDTVSFVTAVNGSTFNVNVVNPDGSSLQTYTTPEISGNSTNTSGEGTAHITVVVSNYQLDAATQFKAEIDIKVRYGLILADNGLDGGRFNIIITQTITGGATYIFNMATNGGLSPGEFFYDTDPTDASGTGATIAEKPGSLSVKHLSGIEYYTTGSQFNFELADIDNYNQNTILSAASLSLRDNSEYGFSNLDQSPIAGGAGNANFTGWTTDYNIQNVSYANTAVTINRSNFRYFGNVANATAILNDSWGGSSSVNTTTSSILVDTVTIPASADTTDNFNDENRRLQKDYTSAWVSANTLTTASTATCQIEVVANLSAGNTVNLTDFNGVARSFAAGAAFAIGVDKEATAVNIAAAINGSVNFGAAAVSPYAAQANFITVNQSAAGPTGNRTNAAPTGTLTVSNFVNGSNGALVMLSYIQYASRATFSDGSTLNADWSTYKPDSAGANPDYSSLSGPASYYRTIVDATGLSRSSFEVTFAGTYNGSGVSNMSQYLQNSALKFFIRKVASSNPSGIAGKTIPPMHFHGLTYSAGTFDQGKTIEGSYVRIDDSAGNTVQGTFGIYGCQNGFYLEIQITDQLLKLDSISVTFV